MTTYIQATDVSELLQIETFSTETSPTLNQVEKIIERKEGRINQRLNHAWGTLTQTESDLYLNVTFVDPRNGVRFDLPNYDVKPFDVSEGDKIEVWNGSEYIEFLSAETAGRDKDYWVDSKLGVLYIRNIVQQYTKRPIRVTYRYGTTVIPKSIEELALYLTAIDVLSMYPKAVNFVDDGNSQTSSQDQRITYFKQEVKQIYNNFANIGTF